MKKLFRYAAVLLLLSTLNFQLSTVLAQGTAFTYQGRLNSSGSPVNGSYDLTFTLYTTNVTGSAIAGPVTNSATAVTNGLFTTLVDFGPGVFTGTSNWLAIAVSTNGANSFSTLAPRQQITPTPYALFAGTASNVSGTLANGNLPASPTFSGTVTANSLVGNGAGVTNVNAAALNGLNATNFWQLGGNNVAAGQFLGSTNNQPLEIRVGGVRAGWISPSNGSPNIVFGPAQNSISNTTAGASILGGINNTIATNSSYSVIGGGQQNSILNNADHSVLGGGYQNSIQTNASGSYLGGGSQNSILSTASYSFLGGGQYNSIQSGANQTFIGGGYQNIIQTSATASVIAGGYANTIQTGTITSFIGGGNDNTLYANAVNSVLGGGYINSINAGDSVLVGGEGNSIQNGASVSVIVGGGNNSIQSNNPTSFIGGGSGNIIQLTTTSGGNAFIGGGANNLIGANCGSSLVVGGSGNQIQAYAFAPSLAASIVGGYANIISPAAYYTFIGGGSGNTIGNGGTNANYAVIPGGLNNYAGGPYSFAAGQRAKANFQGDFVWADSQAADFNSTTNDQFNVRANGGVRFVTGGAGATVDGQPVLAGNISLAQLPAAVVTNNEPNVSLGSLTLGGNLNFGGYPAEISIGAASILIADNNGNFFSGLAAGNLAVSGTYNTAIGTIALPHNVSGSYNTAIGGGALVANTNGSYNTAIGVDALIANTSGFFNTADGASALSANTTGSNNVAIGSSALFASTTGSENTALGFSALGNSTTDNGLVAIGYQALLNDAASGGLFTVGSGNIAIGYQSLLADNSGSGNTGLGYQTLLSNNTGNNNTAIGVLALGATTGTGNIGIGYLGGFSLTSGNNNIDIGNPGVSSDSGIIRIGTPGMQTQTFIAGVIQDPSVTTITITGGSDLAEPFSISTKDQPVSEGEVVVIDEANPGQLKLTDQPYDTRVAGVVSGANGIHPGIQMQQQGLLEGGKNVALTGRVYVQADTSNGAIRPGDLLTTSSTPGHAMKVTDHAKAAGAILGKAMTALSEGKGMVLVLVTLQ